MPTQVYVKQDESYEAGLSLASDADIISGIYQVFVSLVYEWGDVIVDEEIATRDSAGEYSYEFTTNDLNSYGKHKIIWKYTEGGTDYTVVEYINVYKPYITDSEFFEAYPSLETEFSDQFDAMERRVRAFIETVCGQKFQSIKNKSLTYEGDNHENLFLGLRCTNLLEVTQKPDIDVTDTTEVTVESKIYLRRTEQVIPIATQEQKYIQPKFMSDIFYIVRADWGWDSVPTNITEAASLLIVDLCNLDTAYSKHGISSVKMDQYSLNFADAASFGTGNIEVDVLLMDYILYTMGLI
jgi:hypothetical protein